MDSVSEISTPEITWAYGIIPLFGDLPKPMPLSFTRLNVPTAIVNRK